MAETGTREADILDVREAVKDLEKYGLTEIQANGIVIFHLKTTENHVATKWDLRAMEARIEAKLRTDIITWLAIAALIIAVLKLLP